MKKFELSAEQKAQFTPQEQAVVLAMGEMFNTAIEEAKQGTLNEDKVKAFLAAAKKELTEKELKALEDEIATLKAAALEQGKTIAQFNANQSTSSLKGAKAVLAVVEANKEAISKSTTKGNDATFVIKADTVRASVASNPLATDLADIGQLAHRKLSVYDAFRKVTVPKAKGGVVRYVDWDSSTTVRAAAAIAEGAAFPESTAKWTTYTLSLEKIGDIIPMSVELVSDAPMFAQELENFLRVNVSIKVDTDLVTGNGTAPNIKGINAYVAAYTATAQGITDASLYDLLVKVRENITLTGGSKYSPNVALMNISDINKMKLKKDLNNNYILPPFFNQDGMQVDGIVIIEANAVAANTMIVGDSRYGAIYEEEDITVETGYATGDFESDMMSLKARKRLNLLVRNADAGAFRKVTSISGALTTLATP